MAKLLFWLKKNWAAVLILVLVVGAAFIAWKFYNGSTLYTKLLDKYNAQARDHKAEIVKIENINSNLLVRLTELHIEHQAKLKQIEENYQKKLVALAQDQQKSKKKIVENTRANPVFMTNEVTRVFGIPVYQVPVYIPEGP